jgi:NADH-quinone oxidoreductase subunit K
MIVPLDHVITISMILFTIGVFGVLFRRNAFTIFMSIELMLNAVNLALVGFSRYYQSVDGQVFVFLVMTLAAAEVAVGLAIIVALYRNRQTVNIDEINLMKN